MKNAIILSLLFSGLFSGCAGLESRCVQPCWYPAVKALSTATPDSPFTADQARIIFKRSRSWVGAAIPHGVMDCGSGIQSNAMLAERQANPQPKKVTALGRNLLEVTDGKHFFIFAGNRMEGILGKDNSPEAITSRLAKRHNGQSRPTRVIGHVRAGDTLAWNRPPGVMRLEMFSPAGDHYFSLPIKIKTDRIYRIYYSVGFSGVDVEVESSRKKQE